MSEKKKILIVDDDPMNLELIEAMLEDQDYKIVKAYGAHECLDKAASSSPDLILLDVMMPDMDGFEVTRQLKKEPCTRFIPIILVTALSGKADKIEGIEAGADEFLTKPLDGLELTVRVRSLLNVKSYHEKLMHYQEALKAEVAQRTKELQNELQRRKETEAQLVQAQKLKSIGDLAGGIAHDFNNLLMGIQANVSLMSYGTDECHPYHKEFQNVDHLVKRGANLCRQLLEYARKGKRQVKTINLNNTIEQVLETFRRTRKDITIYRDMAEELYPAEVDEGQIEQVLLNLFINAGDAMPEGGTLHITTTNKTDQEMKDRISAPARGRHILLEVRDTGAGMDGETQSRIFEPFYTTKAPGNGTGLGLASAYGIVRGHRGHIDVESTPTKGTTFGIFLPATDKKLSEEEHRPGRKADRAVGGSETILIVDDEETILKACVKMLEKMGYAVFTASGGQEAIEVYKNHMEKIDLVILDMIMPDIGGGKTFDVIKKFNPDAKVVLSSGYTQEGQAEEILKRGCDGFIQKPYGVGTLSESISAALSKP